MYTPPARPAHDAPQSGAGRDRARTQRETIVNRLPLQPPSKTPPPVLITRPLREVLDEVFDEASTESGALVRSRVGIGIEAAPAPAIELTAPRPPRGPEPESVPNLRPRPRHGLVLALIAAGALAAGALTATVVKELDVAPPPAAAEQPVADEPAVPPIVVSELPEHAEPAAAEQPAGELRVERESQRVHRRRAAAPDRDEDGEDAIDEQAGSTAPAAPGYLTVDAIPYATIYIDGEEVGDTPIIRHELSPGSYRVEAVSSAGGTERLSVQIRAGQTLRRRLGARR